jgi:hypothetical protein
MLEAVFAIVLIGSLTLVIASVIRYLGNKLSNKVKRYWIRRKMRPAVRDNSLF